MRFVKRSICNGASGLLGAREIDRSLFFPPPITKIEDTGLSGLWLQDLALKLLYYQGYLTGFRIAEELALPFPGVVDQLIEILKREKLVEVKTAQNAALGEGAYIYGITGLGISRAREALERSQYAGPAPVPLDVYIRAIRAQGRDRTIVKDGDLRRVLAHLVLTDRSYERIGPAVNSGTSVFLYGPPGNGKTSIARAIGNLALNESMYIPYALYIDGQVVKLYDSVNHKIIPENGTKTGSTGGLKSVTGGLKPVTGGLKPVTGGLKPVTGSLRPIGSGGNLGSGGLKPPTSALRMNPRRDMRWVHIHRPFIMVGGELTLAGLDLVFDDVHKYYEAPFQVKANGGILLIDDFGRQQIRPRDLLNRWIVPLENRIDYLTLHTGRKVEVPFDVLVIFSTNLPPKDLVDEAFLRRLRHKIEIKRSILRTISRDLQKCRRTKRGDLQRFGTGLFAAGVVYPPRAQNARVASTRPLRSDSGYGSLP
ncbi:MAG: ATP-binding protein [Anaerolineales bacterium]|nr:ATP-binding protein [Anaerolineales bacterium]